MEVGKADTTDRRQFLAGSTIAATAMAGGLVAGYGMFLRCAGQYLYPSEEGSEWMFVTEMSGLSPGQAKTFQSPTGVSVVVTRRALATADSPAAEDFIALSSVCPHLGCRVHWEPQNNRFFCPCHLGAFDPEGKPTAGPPLAANQSLPEYPLKVEGGLLYIYMPAKSIDRSTYRSNLAACMQGPSTDEPHSAGQGGGGRV